MTGLILHPKHRAYYRSGRPVIKIGPKGALGSHEIRRIHSAPSLGQSIVATVSVSRDSSLKLIIKMKACGILIGDYDGWQRRKINMISLCVDFEDSLLTTIAVIGSHSHSHSHFTLPSNPYI